MAFLGGGRTNVRNEGKAVPWDRAFLPATPEGKLVALTFHLWENRRRSTISSRAAANMAACFGA